MIFHQQDTCGTSDPADPVLTVRYVTAVSGLARLFTKEVQCGSISKHSFVPTANTAQFIRFTTLDTIPAHIFYLTSRIALRVTAGSAAIAASRRPHVAGCCRIERCCRRFPSARVTRNTMFVRRRCSAGEIEYF